MAMTLGGCATFGSPAPSVQIPRDCENLAQRVDPPPVRAGMNAKAALAQTRGALATANGNLDATRECQAAQRQRFAGEGE